MRINPFHIYLDYSNIEEVKKYIKCENIQTNEWSYIIDKCLEHKHYDIIYMMYSELLCYQKDIFAYICLFNIIKKMEYESVQIPIDIIVSDDDIVTIIKKLYNIQKVTFFNIHCRIYDIYSDDNLIKLCCLSPKIMDTLYNLITNKHEKQIFLLHFVTELNMILMNRFITEEMLNKIFELFVDNKSYILSLLKGLSPEYVPAFNLLPPIVIQWNESKTITINMLYQYIFPIIQYNEVCLICKN